jgi:hypothetical protein
MYLNQRWLGLLGSQFAGVVGVLLFLTPALSERDFHDCPPEGMGGNVVLNLLKNRSAMPSKFEEIDFEDLLKLEIPETANKKSRDEWTKDAQEFVNTNEKRAVRVVGYILKVKLEGREPPTCKKDEEFMRNFHLWLANSPDDEMLDAVVVKISSRIRAKNPSWNRTTLDRLVKQKSLLRINGWLMYDQEHPEQLGKTRATLWGIDPIMKIEIRVRGKWRDL